jgi:hypothetical protein
MKSNKHSKPLFKTKEEEETENEENHDIENEGEQSSEVKKKFDKIFNNDYNTGNLEFEEFGIPRVDQEYADAYMESYTDATGYHSKLECMERIDTHFKNSEAGKAMGMKKKIPKQMLCKIYLLLKEAFRPGELTEVEYFTTMAEYFGMSYEVLYENIPAIHREMLVKELDNKFSILKRKGVKKLF